MKVIIFVLFVIASVYSLEDSDLGIKPKRGLGFSLGYNHHSAPLYGHSYVAPAPAIVHHAPVLAAPAVVHAPIARYHAPLIAHAPAVAVAHHHAPIAYSHAPIAYAHAPYFSSLHHYKK